MSGSGSETQAVSDSDFPAFDADTDAGYDLEGRSESLRRVGNRNGGTWDYFCFRGGGSGGSS